MWDEAPESKEDDKKSNEEKIVEIGPSSVINFFLDKAGEFCYPSFL